jgi:hypothetical protein
MDRDGMAMGPATVPLDNVTELLQSTGVAEVTAAPGVLAGSSRPRRQAADWGGAVASLTRQAQRIDRGARSQ